MLGSKSLNRALNGLLFFVACDSPQRWPLRSAQHPQEALQTPLLSFTSLCREQMNWFNCLAGLWMYEQPWLSVLRCSNATGVPLKLTFLNSSESKSFWILTLGIMKVNFYVLYLWPNPFLSYTIFFLNKKLPNNSINRIERKRFKINSKKSTSHPCSF